MAGEDNKFEVDGHYVIEPDTFRLQI